MKKSYAYADFDWLDAPQLIDEFSCFPVRGCETSDDHFRNHVFLLTRKGWELSPAYDINPTVSDNPSLLVNCLTSDSDLNILLESAGEYMISPEKAKTIIDKVKSVVKSWLSETRKLVLPQRDIAMLAPRFDRWNG